MESILVGFSGFDRVFLVAAINKALQDKVRIIDRDELGELNDPDLLAVFINSDVYHAKLSNLKVDILHKIIFVTSMLVEFKIIPGCQVLKRPYSLTDVDDVIQDSRKISLFDPRFLRGLDSNLRRDVVNSWLIQSRKHVRDIRKAITNSDWDEVRRLAHTLKGSSAQIGATLVSHMARIVELEEALSEERAHGVLRDLALNIEKTFALISRN